MAISGCHRIFQLICRLSYRRFVRASAVRLSRRVLTGTSRLQLLDRNPDTRLGSGETDVEELFAHPFFCAIDREGLLDNSVPPPFVPAVAGVDDTSNFDEEFTARPAIDSVVPESVLKKLAESEESGAFKDFAFAESDSSGLLAATKAAMRDLGISEAGEQ